MKIRKVNIHEVDKLKEIGRLTFFETFASDNSEENMLGYLNSQFSSDKLKTELIDINTEFYFAEVKENVIGYLKVNFGQSQTEMIGKNSLEIERIYVLKEFHGKKVGQLLFEKAVDIAKSKKAEYVWLGVWEENPRAIRFYEKNGFVVFDKHVFKLGNDLQTDLLMKQNINSKNS